MRGTRCTIQEAEISGTASRRFSHVAKLQESSCLHVCMEPAQVGDFSATFAQGEVAKLLQPLPTSAQLWAARQKTVSMEDIKLRRRKPAELCWLATVSLPDISARLARIASRVHSSQEGEVYRINDPVKTVKVWQQVASLKCLSSPRMSRHVRGDVDGRRRQRRETIHGGTMTLVGWSNAACGDRPTTGKCRLGYVIGLMSSTLRGPCRIPQWP